jgi:disulfide bond formation protein DsbB
MSATVMTAVRSNPAVTAALAVAAVGAATILGALFFQFGLNIQPCPLCLEQRFAYYVGVPLALMIAVMAARNEYRPAFLAALAILALLFLANSAFGVYHAGVEWTWWPGPQDCTGPVTGFGKAGDLLSQMEKTVVVRCDVVQFRFLGLSLAGYNAIISLALAAVAAWGFVAARRAG